MKIHKCLFIISFFAVFLFGFPFKWIFFEGKGVDISGISPFEMHRMFYEFSLLFINAFIIYFLLLFLNRVINSINSIASLILNPRINTIVVTPSWAISNVIYEC